MNLEGAAYLIALYARADIFLLVFVRFVGFFAIVPIFSGKNIPVMTRLGFALLLSLMVFTSGNIKFITLDDNIIGYALLILKEFIVGIIIGYVAFFVFNILYLSGFLSDQQIGLTMANVFDPISQVQVPISGNLYYFMLCAFFVVTGGHRMIISTFFYSFEALPIGTAVILNNEMLLKTMVELMVQFFIIGTLVALPVIGVILVLDVALGVMARAVPRMNIFAVGMSLKIFIGLIILWIVSPMFITVYEMIYELLTEELLKIIKVMMP